MTAPSLQAISVTRRQAAELTGFSVKTIDRAIKANKLVEHYPGEGGKAVILVDDLRTWVATSPTESRQNS